MSGTYPNYSYNTKTLKYDIPNRDDIWNGSDANDVNEQILIHQSLLIALLNSQTQRVSIPFSSQTFIFATHDFGVIPIVQVMDNSGDIIIPDNVNANVNTVTVTFFESTSGTIILLG